MVTESGITVSGNTLLELMKHIGNDRHLTMKQPMETVLTRSEWKLRWEASTRGAEELGPGAGRNGENPWDLPAAHARLHCVRIGGRRVGENRHSLVTCHGWEIAQSLSGQLCRVPASAFNEIPLILLPEAQMVSNLQN